MQPHHLILLWREDASPFRIASFYGVRLVHGAYLLESAILGRQAVLQDLPPFVFLVPFAVKPRKPFVREPGSDR